MFRYVMGIDVDSEGGYLCVMSTDKKCLFETKYTNPEFYSLISSEILRIAPPHESLVVMESTGGYAFFPYQVFTKAGYRAVFENARLIKDYARSFSFRGKKTDKYDARIIAQYGIERVLAKDFRPYEYSELKERLARMRKQKQVVESVAFSRMVMIFPSITMMFGSNPFKTKIGRVILTNYEGWHDVVAQGKERLREVILSVRSAGRYGGERFVEELYTFAEKMAKSGYLPDKAIVYNFRHRLAELEFFESSLARLEEYIARLGDSIEDVILLRTISGIGRVSSVILHAEIGDVRRFRGRDELWAYIGFDPKYEESGFSVRRRGEISRAGISYVRAILYQAVMSLIRNGQLFHEEYRKLRERKKHKLAMMVLLRKYTRIIYQILKKKEPFRIPEGLKREWKEVNFDSLEYTVEED